MTFEQFTERVYKGLKADLTKGTKPLTYEELRKLILEDKDLTNANISEIFKLDELFKNMVISEKQIIEMDTWDTSHIESMNSTFFRTNIKRLPKWDFSNVTTAFDMCFGSDIQEVNIVAPKLKKASSMFDSCPTLVNVNIEIKGVETNAMFRECQSLKEVNIKTTTSIINGSGMFRYCVDLEKVSELDISEMTKGSRMFFMCKNIDNLKFKKPNKLLITDSMFDGCVNLKNSDFSGWNVPYDYSMFRETKLPDKFFPKSFMNERVYKGLKADLTKGYDKERLIKVYNAYRDTKPTLKHVNFEHWIEMFSDIKELDRNVESAEANISHKTMKEEIAFLKILLEPETQEYINQEYFLV